MNNTLQSPAQSPAQSPTITQNTDPSLLLRHHHANGVTSLTLNRPEARNALSMALMSALEETLDELAADKTTQAVIIKGAGPGFCAGHDLKEIRANPNRDFYQTLFDQCSRVMLAIQHLPKPVIAQVHGIATAAGCQLVASCDLAIAASGSRFATPGVNIGLFCSTPMVALSRAIGRKAAMSMLLTGEMIQADEAVRLGLINRVVPAQELEDQVIALATQIAAKSPLTLAIGKQAFYTQADMDIERAYGYCAEVMTRNMRARDAEEGIDAFIQKRHPIWTGS